MSCKSVENRLYKSKIGIIIRSSFIQFIVFTCGPVLTVSIVSGICVGVMFSQRNVTYPHVRCLQLRYGSYRLSLNASAWRTNSSAWLWSTISFSLVLLFSCKATQKHQRHTSFGIFLSNPANVDAYFQIRSASKFVYPYRTQREWCQTCWIYSVVMVMMWLM